MKRALYFTIIYLVSLLAGTLLFASLFMFSCNLSMFVTGLPASFFSLRFFVSGLIITFPLVCVIVQVLLILYIIRHPGSYRLSFILYLIFGLLSWLLFVPADLKLYNRYESNLEETRVTMTSSGFFRKEAGGVIYYSRIDEYGNADGLFIDTSDFQESGNHVVPFFDVPAKNESAFPYSDILIKNSLEPPKLVTYPLALYSALLTAGEYSAALGFLAWLSFASIGLALLSVFGLQFASSWKLANVAFVITGVVIVIVINYLYYMNIMPGLFREISLKLSWVTSIKDPFIILVNLAIGLLFSAFGIFMGIYRLNGTYLLENEE